MIKHELVQSHRSATLGDDILAADLRSEKNNKHHQIKSTKRLLPRTAPVQVLQTLPGCAKSTTVLRVL